MATKFGGKNPCPERNALLGNAANATEHYAAAGALVTAINLRTPKPQYLFFTFYEP